MMSFLSALERVKHHHKTAFDYISSALEIDEQQDGDKDQAVELYLRGIEELQKGIQEECIGASRDDRDKAERIQSKMKNNLKMAKERLNSLMSGEDESKSSAAGTGKQKSKHDHDPKSSMSSQVKNRKRPSSRNAAATVSTGTSKLEPKSLSDSRKPWNHGLAAKPAVPNSKSNPKAHNNQPISKTQPKNVVAEKSNRDRMNIKNVPKEMVNKILDELVEPGSHSVRLADVAGQEIAKQALNEIVILPALRPEFFTGLRTPARGLLLFGPPGTGKTLLAKAVAAEANSNFFNISASTLTSKWVGEGEKMVKAMFSVAREVQPTIIFIDEIDSFLCERKEGESDSTRRLKTEFMLRFDGIDSNANERILVMGATNRPHELDDAVLRRFPKRVYVGLPDTNARIQLLQMLLKKQNSVLPKQDIQKLAMATEFYSGSDLTELAKDAALGPVREMTQDQLVSIDVKQMRSIQLKDFEQSLKKIRPSVSKKLLKIYEEWNSNYGDNS